jgi:Xaa-Pro aminopeptidase
MKNILLFILSLTIGIQNSNAQASNPKPSLSPSFFKDRREALRALMPVNSVFVLFSYPERNYSLDTDYPYHPNPDLFYFSGYKEPDALMLIFKEPHTFNGIETAVNEILFVPAININAEKWTGKKMNYKEAMGQLGIQYATETFKFKSFPIDFSTFNILMLDILPSDVRDDENNQADLFDLVKQFKEKANIQKSPNRMSLMLKEFTVERNNPSQKKLIDSLLNEHINYLLFDRYAKMLREVKTSEELAVLQKAIDVSCAGHNEAMKSMRVDMSEHELQAIHEYMHKKGGAETEGYPPIVASGNNGCVLHYSENSAEKLGNNLVVMDVGAEYHGYSADITRTVPANGKFSPEQLIIYNVVLSAHDSAIMAIRKGLPYYELEKIGQQVIANGLIKLGLIKNKTEVSVYYPHGISHPIGLDVHDKYRTGINLEKNMVITIEPGIYISEGSNCDKKWWGIGVRIEDDVLVLDDKGEVLSEKTPVKPKEIEKLMKQKSIFKLSSGSH